MAEIVALGASVVAFIQLTDRVLQLAKYYIGAVKDCPSDIRTILVEVSTLKAVLETLDLLLKNTTRLEPRMLAQLAGENGPIEGCRRSLTDLERLLPADAKASRGKRQKILSAAGHLAWPLKETNAKKLLDNISRYKASISFAITYDSMYVHSEFAGRCARLTIS